MKQVQNLHNKLVKNTSPFALASVAALIVGGASTAAIAVDIFWLLGDMSIQIHSHHYFVLAGLSIALIATVASFAWLYRAITVYLGRKEAVPSYKAFLSVLAYDEVKHSDRGYVLPETVKSKTKKSAYVYRETTD